MKIKVLRNVRLPEPKPIRTSIFWEQLTKLRPPSNGILDALEIEDEDCRKFNCPYEIAERLGMKISYKKMGPHKWNIYRIE